MNQQSELDRRRRPLKSRERGWSKYLLRKLSTSGVTPNQVSVASVGFAALSGIFLLFHANFGGALGNLMLCAAILGIQLRLLCNLLDGMLAVEGGLRSPIGEIYNDLPDRISDSILFLSAGYAIGANEFYALGAALGWLAALLAVLTAYVRLLGAAAGTPHFFHGPMAKQHRMAVLTAALLLQIVELYFGETHRSLLIALLIISGGSAMTIFCRTRMVIDYLEREQSSSNR